MSSRPDVRRQLSPTTGSEIKQPSPVGRLGVPDACGPLSETVRNLLTAPSGRRPVPRTAEVEAVTDPLTDRDLQLALWMLYELHYRGFADVDDALEWDPVVLLARRTLEAAFERTLRDRSEAPDPLPDTPDELVTELTRMTLDDTEPTLAAYLARDASEEQFLAFLSGRAVYHLREADAQCFLLARLGGAAKTALAEIQYDELGAGRPDRLHADIYARGLASVGLSTDIGDHLPETGAAMLALVNTGSFFNLHRRLRGAAAGHFAAFEATSSVPCRLIAEGAERLGLPEAVVDYWSEHVEADAVHEQVAVSQLCGALAAAEPDLVPDIVLGAQSCLTVDALAADAVLAGWGERPDDPERLAS
jgi:hypothetical protein